MNPYIVLNIPSGASAVDIKKAYHSAVKRCHPDKFAGTARYNSAQEELKRVNLAYDMLADKLRADFQAKNEKAEKTAAGAELDYDARILKYAYELAMERRLSEAYLFLSKAKRRGAQWHYLHGLCKQKAGAYTEAINDFEIAMKMEPGNGRYRDEWRSTVCLRSKRRKRAAAIGTVAAAAVTITVIAVL